MAIATATAIALAAVAASTALGAYSAVQQGEAAEDAAEYNAKVAENNAQAAADQAAAEALQVRRAARLRAGTQRAGYGKAGVDLSGSAEDVYIDAGTQGELEALSTLYAGATQSGYYQSRAVGSRFEGRQARAAGNLNAAATVIGGLGTGASLGAGAFQGGSEPGFRPNTGRSSGQLGYGRG